jgi:hypothetical protein
MKYLHECARTGEMAHRSGGSFERKKGDPGHIVVRKGDNHRLANARFQEFGTGLVNAIKKQLGLK